MINKKNQEEVLLSFWLPLRKSNFINLIDKINKDNLVYKIIEFSFEYNLNIQEFNINLTKSLYNNIFKLKENSVLSEHNQYVKDHLCGNSTTISISGGDETTERLDTRETLISYRYQITKKNSANQYININFSKTALSDISNMHIKFKFTEDSINLLNKLDIVKHVKRRELYMHFLENLEFDLFIDEYGFYYININMAKPIYYIVDYNYRQLIVELFFSFNNKFNILTFDQIHIIRDGLLFEYDIDNISQDNSTQSTKVEDFFKKIIKVYHFDHFKNNEYFDTLIKNEVDFILDTRNDNELNRRVLNIPFFDYCKIKEKNKDIIVRNWVLNTNKYISTNKIEYLYKLFLQDKIEKNAMNRFLEVSTSITYIGQIINQIKDARDNLRALINETTETEVNETRVIVERTEEELSRYIEKLFSKIPNLKTIDTFLQEAYYIKIGNFSFMNYMESSESIIHLHQYIKWRNLLENIDNTALSLQTILQVYQNRQSIEELEELRINELSSSDKNDIRTITSNENKSLMLDEKEKDFLVILSLLIAFSDFYKDIWNIIINIIMNITHNNIISISLSITIGIGIVFVASKLIPIVYHILFYKKNKITLDFLGINTIELRSKKKHKEAIGHEKHHNFTKKIEAIIGSIEKHIDNKYHNLLNKAKRRVLFTRVNPRKRTLRVKYIFDQNKGKEYFDVSELNIEKYKNKRIKIRFFVVYNFTLKLIEESDKKSKFNLYNNSAKIYFNIGIENNNSKRIKKHLLLEYEDAIRKQLYEIFLKSINNT